MKRALNVIILTMISGLSFITVSGQSYMVDIVRDSARSDVRTGGTIETADIKPDDRKLFLSVNVPSFEMTLWQNGKEVKRYPIGVGLKDYPIFVGRRQFDTIIFNPAWIPPASDWVAPALQGQIIGPADPRNPLGKMKIPLGYGYLIHQAKGVDDLGSLVSHGCVRVMRNDLYDLNAKLLTAHSLKLEPEVTAAKNNKSTFVIELEEPVELEITYDTLVIENGTLRIYPDVYDFGKNTAENLREELSKNGVDTSAIEDRNLSSMIAKATNKSLYSIGVDEIRKGNFLKGKIRPVVAKPEARRSKKKK